MFGNAAIYLERMATVPGNDQHMRAAASAFGCSVLRALSAELALKFLAYLRSGTAPSGHDLWELYDGLDPATKDVIETVDARTRSATTFPSVGDILKANRDAFVSVRYLSLKSPPMTLPDWRALGRAHDVLVETGHDPGFRTLCPSGVKHV